MFVDAIEKVSRFTRPIMFITRYYGSEAIYPALGTLFFVNGKGAAVTCKHVASMILNADRINANYTGFKKERSEVVATSSAAAKKALKDLEKKYSLKPGAPANCKVKFLDVPSPFGKITVHMHPTYDLAIVIFENIEKLNYDPSEIYLLADGSKAKQGRSLCRLGYPFPEFKNYEYNVTVDDIDWTQGKMSVPRFPIDGIITRHIANDKGEIFGIEMSTPGLRGQSGGPLFDTDGVIYGMQFATHHLHLGFDMVNMPMTINGREKVINNQPFLHVGQCLHINVIKEFLDSKGIEYKTK